MGKRKKNNYYAFDNGTDRGIVTSWPACEAKVKGRRARYRGFPDRASAERWLAGEETGGGGRSSGKVYAYVTESGQGIVDSWDACERRVRGRKARYRSFRDRRAAEAWLAAGAPQADPEATREISLRAYPDDAVFFDSGTGAGRGAEVKVVDRAGVPLVHLAGDLPGPLTKEGTVLLGRSRTNNYGELTACLLALRVARSLGAKHVYGDSRLVLDYWSRGRITREKREGDPDLARLVEEAARERRAFEAAGGRLDHVPGGINPADLGFHKD